MTALSNEHRRNVCISLLDYTFYAQAYILGVQTIRFYRHAGRMLCRWLKWLLHRLALVVMWLCIKPIRLLRQSDNHSQKNGVFRLLFTICAVLWIGLSISAYAHNTLAYAVQYMDQTIAYTASEEIAANGIQRAMQLMQFFDMPETPVLSRAVISKTQLCDVVGVSNAIIACHSDTLTESSGLFVAHAYMGALTDRAALEQLLESIRTAMDDGTESQPSVFAQEVTITDGAYPTETLISVEALRKKLESSHTAPVYYTVQSGDTLSSIARACDLSLSQLRANNPAFSQTDTIHVGDKLLITKAGALLQVHRYKQITYTESIPFETKTRQNSNHFIGEKYISTKGVKGKQEVTAEIELTDGIETARKILQTKVLQKPVTQKVQIGSRKGSKNGKYVSGDGIATGNFTWPVPSLHTITSYFGRRWGTIHQGLDISGYNASGKAVVAADGGKVYAVNTTSKWGTGMFAGYGYAVIIDHGNGLKTLYGHCSKVVVRANQKISRGQVIAYVGSTGYSTGAHLHFEVRVNNRRVNPLSYLQ